MKIHHKSLIYFILWACVSLFSCSGPTEKRVAKTAKNELPEKADSLKHQAKDGTDVENDTTNSQ